MSVIRGLGVESNKATKGASSEEEGVGWNSSTIISGPTRQVLLSKDYITPTYILLHQTTFHIYREGDAFETISGGFFMIINSSLLSLIQSAPEPKEGPSYVYFQYKPRDTK